MNMAKSKQTGAASSKPPSDYERISKKHAKSKSTPIVQDAPSIRDFLASSILTTEELAQLNVGADMSKSDVIWMFELGKPFVKLDIKRNLTTQMC